MPSATNTQKAEAIVCGGNCSNCSGSVCAANHLLLDKEKERVAAEAAAKKAAAAAAAKEAAAKKAAEAGKSSVPADMIGKKPDKEAENSAPTKKEETK